MEVHHPHHPTHKKKWKEYLLEFFMLFLAVSLGFLAENVREGYVEKERSHELVASFMKDVAQNLRYIDSLIDSDKKSMYKTDSTALYIINTNKDIDLGVVFEIPTHSYRYLNNNDTYDQMKSAGSLRYIKDEVLLSKMIEYSNLSKATEFRSVTQEYNYFANEFQNTLNKYIPIEIAAYKHISAVNQYPERYAISNGDSASIKMTEALIAEKKYILPNNQLNVFKADMVPVLYRKTSLVLGTMNFMYRTKEAGKDLLEYYKSHHEE